MHHFDARGEATRMVDVFDFDAPFGAVGLLAERFFLTAARLLYLYTTLDGGTIVRKAGVASVVIPAGTFRVLTVIVRHPATVRNADLANWEAAQAKINQDHATVAASRQMSVAQDFIAEQ